MTFLPASDRLSIFVAEKRFEVIVHDAVTEIIGEGVEKIHIRPQDRLLRIPVQTRDVRSEHESFGIITEDLGIFECQKGGKEFDRHG